MANRKIEIRVVLHEEEKLFESDGVKFDLLYADQMWKGGKLTIMRDGSVFDQTSYIREYGTHAATTCFCGLSKITKYKHAANGLQPVEFEIGDEILIEFPARRGNKIKFSDRLRQSACNLFAFVDSFKEKSVLSGDELFTKVSELKQQTIRDYKDIPIVRFIRKQNT